VKAVAFCGPRGTLLKARAQPSLVSVPCEHFILIKYNRPTYVRIFSYDLSTFCFSSFLFLHFLTLNSVNYPVLSCPVLSCPVLSRPVLSCPVLSCPVLSCPVLSRPVLYCPVLIYPNPSHPIPPCVRCVCTVSALCGALEGHITASQLTLH
jgi:hypothetical protein